MKRWKLLLLTLIVWLPGQAMAEIIVEDAWVRLPPPVADTAAAYMTIKNSGDHDVKITSVICPAARNPEFHMMRMNGNMMQMMKMDPVVVPAGSGITFSPNGNHLMLIGLTGELKTGEHIMMTLKSSDGDSIMVHAVVRDMRGGHGSHEMNGDMQGGHEMNNDMHGGMHH